MVRNTTYPAPTKLTLFGRIRGVIPILLTEISPPAFRAVFSGLTYQLHAFLPPYDHFWTRFLILKILNRGNMISSASAQIEAKAGESVRALRTIRDCAQESDNLISRVGPTSEWIARLRSRQHDSHRCTSRFLRFLGSLRRLLRFGRGEN